MLFTCTSEKQEVFDEPVFDHSLVSLHEHTYKPYGSSQYKNSDVIKININFQDVILDIADSYIFIEGKYDLPNEEGKQCYLSNNILAFLFEGIRLEMGGEQVAVVRKPGIITTMKTMVYFGQTHARNRITSGWGLNQNKQTVLDTGSHIFSGKLPLKYLMGFAEDYRIARSFKDSYIGQVECQLKIFKIEWKIRLIVPR